MQILMYPSGCGYVRGVIHAGDTCDEFKPRGGSGSERAQSGPGTLFDTSPFAFLREGK
jgi:hypothetical protein